MGLKHVFAIALASVLVLSTASCSRDLATASTGEQSSADPAMALVKRLDIARNLESLAVQVAHSTTTYGVLVQEHGKREADLLIKREIAKALPPYQQRWEANLAGIYSRHFSAAELASLAAEGRRSPYANKLEASKAQIGAEMRKASTPLLKDLVTEALKNAATGG